MPPPQHQQQQQTGAGPDKEMMEVKQLLKQALGGAGILNHARVRFRQAMQFSLTFVAHHEYANSRHPHPSRQTGVACRRGPFGHG